MKFDILSHVEDDIIYVFGILQLFKIRYHVMAVKIVLIWIGSLIAFKVRMEAILGARKYRD